MRLLLDAHLSGRRVGPKLTADGHDVRAVDQERRLDGYSDQRLLDLATSDNRILATFNARDFAQIARGWGAEGRSHAGLILLVSMSHHEFGSIIEALRRSLAARPDQAHWRDHLVFAGRPSQG